MGREGEGKVRGGGGGGGGKWRREVTRHHPRARQQIREGEKIRKRNEN